MLGLSKDSVGTYVVDDVARVAAECEESVAVEGCNVDTDCLESGHDERGGDETDPVVVDERERGRTESDDGADCYAECEEERREGCNE